MTRLALLSILAGCLLLGFAQNRSSDNSLVWQAAYRDADSKFREAERLSFREDDASLDRSDQLYKQARQDFERLLPPALGAGMDSLVFFTRLRIAFIEYYFDSLPSAKKHYLSALAIWPRLKGIEDSFLFKPYLFTGSIYHSVDQADSALHFYKKAEAIALRYHHPLEESQRLYNRLGVMFYENGDYRQSRNYFEKAIAILAITEPTNESLLVNYRINIGSLLVKLEEYDQARAVYESILPYGVLRNEIFHNLGIIEEKLGNHARAIQFLRQVNYGEARRNIDLYYNLGMNYASLGKPDSSAYYIERALQENTKWNAGRRNIPYGLLLKFQGDGLLSNQLFKQAVEKYQQAIRQFAPAFEPVSVYQNPAEFSTVFSYINLFNTLAAKADALQEWYGRENDLTFLEAALDAYRSAFRLADHVEKNYNSDEARLFLNRIKYQVHSKPIGISLAMYEGTKKKNYLEEAYQFDQRNKASVLSLNVRENEWREKYRANDPLLQQEFELRSQLTRLALKAAQATDSARVPGYHSAIRELEIRLGRLQEEIAKSDHAKQQLIPGVPPVNYLQQQLDPVTAVLSYHLSGREVLTLLITRNRFEYYRTPVTRDFFAIIDSFKQALQPAEAEQRYRGTEFSGSLYKILLSPLEKKLRDIQRLIVIPDDELHYLPFEALQDSENKYLVEKWAVQYQYSASLLYPGKARPRDHRVLAFAPFASRERMDPAGNTFTRLPASGEETSGLPGEVFRDSAATKTNFLKSANRFGTLHLATHAAVDNTNPLRSYIAFYPNAANEEYKLYAQEIYGLRLDSSRLVILSACETGTGKLVRGEGLMSLSRAFAYAGCPNIITSLWKAEDRTTAFITRQIHHYLDKGFSHDKALQQAKLDLLHSPDTDPRFRAPGYWAHLVFIGQYEPASASNTWWWIGGAIIVLLTIVIITKRKYTLSVFSS